MGELGDWGYWLLFVITALVVFVWGYAVGYDEGKKDGIRAKEKRHIDAKYEKIIKSKVILPQITQGVKFYERKNMP